MYRLKENGGDCFYPSLAMALDRTRATTVNIMVVVAQLGERFVSVGHTLNPKP